MTQPSPTKQYRPREITTACPGRDWRRSPRIIAPLEMMVLPPRIMFCGPAIVARLETLFPVSWKAKGRVHTSFRRQKRDLAHSFDKFWLWVVDWRFHVVVKGTAAHAFFNMSLIRLATSCRRFAFLPLSSSLRFSTISTRILTGPLQRSFSVNQRKLQQLPDSKPAPDVSPNSSTDTSEAIYHGPLAPTIMRLKQFSLTSLSLSFIMSPLIFIIESNLPGFARAALAATAIGTSGISTALVSWAARPYVTTLRRLDPSVDGVKGLEMTTLTWTLQPRITRVHSRSRSFARFSLRVCRSMIWNFLSRQIVLWQSGNWLRKWYFLPAPKMAQLSRPRVRKKQSQKLWIKMAKYWAAGWSNGMRMARATAEK